ncbi:purine permease 3-like [Cynara cardunculus var. scolymus]|uniref:purine permease 3-like n=1 Tax=Cynara cardunculus var. scolymus TaxID=59895 RepID=UPI000D62875F|nr:purine permease 3-like [Cynara cardunculus var. scolymus]
MDSQTTSNEQAEYIHNKMNRTTKKALLALNCIMLAIGNCGGPLVQRLYFIKGGKEIWISSWLLTAGWPFLILPLILSFLYQKRTGRNDTKLFSLKPNLLFPCAVLGVLTGLDDYLAAYGVSRLPVSTSALIIATQLAFTAGFAFLLVKQKFSAFTINSIFLLSIGAVILGLHSSTDRPAHESRMKYYEGFFMTLGASALYGFILPSIELTFKKAKQPITYSLVMEMQIVISFFATAFCTIGMLVNRDFKAIPREARTFKLGEDTYYVVLMVNALFWQFFFLGAIGVIFCASSLLSGIIIATLLPVTESLAVLFFHERFPVEKGISLTLSLWGFLSYFYGEFRRMKKTYSNGDLEVA